MKTNIEKQMEGALAKEGAIFQMLRSRKGRKRSALPGTKDIWRALSSASLSSSHTPVLRRLRD